MANRYGRNQKRAHHARIAELEAVVSALTTELQRAQSRVTGADLRYYRARTDAFDDFMRQHDRLEAATREMGAALGRAVGEELREAAGKVATSYARERQPWPVLEFEVIDDRMSARVITIRGTIPSHHYQIQILR